MKAALECPAVGSEGIVLWGRVPQRADVLYHRSRRELRIGVRGQFVELHQCMKHAAEFEEFTKELVENEAKELLTGLHGLRIDRFEGLGV